MKCEKCKTDTDAGEWYQFYYGTLLASWTSYQRRYVDALERVTSKKYRIEGSEKVFFCYKCMSEEKAKAHWKTGGAIILWSLFLGLSVSCIIAELFLSPDGGPSTLLTIGLLSPAIAFFLAGLYQTCLAWLIYRAVRSDDLQVLYKCTLDEFTGDQLAISMRESDPKYPNRELLNRGEYRRLSPSQNAWTHSI